MIIICLFNINLPLIGTLIIHLLFKFRKLSLRLEVKDDTTMRDDKDFLSYKTYVYNFFNSSNFFNFTQVEPAKLEFFKKSSRFLQCFAV